MFKLVVLCAFLAAATANPGAIIAPLSYSGNLFAPTPAVYASNPSSLLYSSPVVASAPLAVSTPYGFSHLIKKRSAPLALSSYIAPSPYYAATPLVNTYAAHLAGSYAAPLATTYSAPLYSTAHLIKKRSAPLIVPSTYLAPTTYAAATPFVASTYAAGPVISTPYISTAPYAYGPHFIKKRSAPLAVAAYSAPASFSHQSRFDFQATSPAITTYSSFPSPAIYPSVAVPHLI